MTGGDASTTTNLETMGPGAPTTTANLPIASGVGVNSPSLFRPTEYAILALASTTVTAYAVPDTTGLAILGDETLTFRAEGTTLPGGDVVSLGFDGLVESTTTATYQPFTGVSPGSLSSSSAIVLVQTVSGTTSFSLPTAPGPVIFGGSTFPPLVSSSMSVSSSSMARGGLTSSGQSMATFTSSPAQTSSESRGGSGGSSSTSMEGGGGADGAAPSSSSQQAGATVSAGRAAVLLGAMGGVVAWGL